MCEDLVAVYMKMAHFFFSKGERLMNKEVGLLSA
jgi:hypothetical protein